MFTRDDGDFRFECAVQPNGTQHWTRTLLNTPGAEPEELTYVSDVPLHIRQALGAELMSTSWQAQNQAAG